MTSNQIEASVATFFFSLLIISGIMYTLSIRFHFEFPWLLIPVGSLIITGVLIWRARVRRGATPKDPQPPQTP